MPIPRLFTIPPGAPFLPTFARALRAGDILPGLSDPLALAGATIYVPTRRAARALTHELGRAFGGPARLLPRIRPLGGLEEGAAAQIDAEPDLDGARLALAPAMGEVERRMLLTRLILDWVRMLPHAIIRLADDGALELDPSEPLLVANTFAGAWRLSADLAALIDELIIEDVAWEKLGELAGDFDAYWGITLKFLNIAIELWPGVLAGREKVDAARRQAQLAQRQIERMRAGAQGPVIALGSTGTNRATARLLAAIARAPQGAVVLPGLDHGLDEAAFRAIGAADAAGFPRGAGHPQAALRRLLAILGVERDEVVELGAPGADLAGRARLVSQALRPADSTELWPAFLAEFAPQARVDALKAVAFVEAADEREEALCLAIAMREALETPGKTAALITPDRNLAARVKAELARWDIEIDDSGGDALGALPMGALARLALACAASRRGAMDLIALLNHPLVVLGRGREDVERLAPLVEIGVLRVVAPDVAENGDGIAAARAAAAARHAHPAAKAIADADWEAISLLMRALETALAGLERLTRADLADWVKAHREALAALSAPAPQDEDAAALEALFDELAGAALPGLPLDMEAYQSFFDQLTRETAVRGPRRAHPRLKILGLLEARLLHVDLAVLGGLDETVWPPQAAGDPFLNSPMRAHLGLTTPERRIGQTAHDFAQALGNGEIILSRARKRGGSPMVASRFVQRLQTLAGADWEACAKAGARFLALARALDRPHNFPPARRPEPRPPLRLRPRQLSVTRIETLRRDPYAIHAESILRLAPLDPLGVEMGARERGEMLHEALADFVRRHPHGKAPPDGLAEVTRLAREKMAPLLANAAFAAFQWPRVEKSLVYYIAFETERRGDIVKILAEEAGRWPITLDDGSSFLLSAVADRLETRRDRRVAVVDYKTGEPPGKQEVRIGLAPQLTLTAALAECGAFPNLPAESVAGAALYLKLGGSEGGKVVKLKWDDAALSDVIGDHWQELLNLLNQFRQAQTPYLSRPIAKWAQRHSDYDHLARVAEWSAGATEESA